MGSVSRRDFLKRLGAASALLLANRSGLDIFAAGETRPFEFLVVGDSIAWGQGLEEKDKFYSLTADWLRREVFTGRRDVNVKVKAHSGSALKFHADEAEKYLRAKRDETYFYKPELSVRFPSIWKQIEVAADEYKSDGKTGGADLIILTGGATDILVSKILDPYGDNAKLPPLIQKYCRDDMFDVLEHAADRHPRGMIAVVGYFSMLSPKTPTGKLFNSWLELMRFPRSLKPFINNGIVRPLFFNRLRRKSIARSRIWVEESNKCLKTAVDKLNAKYDKPRAVFIKSPITEDTCFETPNTLLFRIGKKGVAEDPLYATRAADCDKTLPELKKTIGIDYPVRPCEIGSVGHPNAKGARAYADEIKAVLTPLIR